MSRRVSFGPDTAFVLGAGLGTRLRPLTASLPKPMLPVAGEPMIAGIFDRLADAGVRRILVNTHWCPEAYAAGFPERRRRGAALEFVHEPTLLETGGGLKNIEPLLGDAESLYVYNGDIFAEPDLRGLAAAHAAHPDAEATLLLRTRGEPRNVLTDAAGRVTDVRGRLGRTDGEARLFSGVWIASRSFFRRLEAGRIESVVEGWLRAIAERPGSIRCVTDDSGRWHDLGTVAEYEAVCAAARGNPPR